MSLGNMFTGLRRDHRFSSALGTYHIYVRVCMDGDFDISDNFLWVEEYLEETFLHTTLIRRDDPMLSQLTDGEMHGFFDIRLVEDVDWDKLTRMLFDDINPIVGKQTDGRVYVAGVTIEDKTINDGTYFEYTHRPERIA